MSRQSKLAIPLVLPNDCTWDEKTGVYEKKDGVERTTLEVIPKALDRLREIKGPVCVVSIAGPCRMGKSYILSKAFEQGEVFRLGHTLDPETMGIWLWVVPQTFKDSTGRDFTVVLLDSEGIDAATSEKTDDHRIFTLSVLLSSILIYNSSQVPKRSDLESLEFIVKLAKRIKLYAGEDMKNMESKHFSETFPDFIWLVRDVLLQLPTDCNSIKDYFLKRIFDPKKVANTEKSGQAAKSILDFFKGFDAFSLPPPTNDQEVLQHLSDKSVEDKLNRNFKEGVQNFKPILHKKLTPKRSINKGESVTGEALAAMVQLFVEALNTPGAVPNVQNAWETFVLNKCIELTNDLLKKYEKQMKSQLQEKIPCDTDKIRAEHEKAMDAGLAMFRKETACLLSKSVEGYVYGLTEKMESVLLQWMKRNEEATDKYCTNLLKDLKKQILDQVFARLHGSEGSSMEFKDIVEAYNELEKTYNEEARGDRNFRAVVFQRFHPDINEELQRNIHILEKLKDYDASMMVVKAQNAALEQQKEMVEEQNKRLEEAQKARAKELEFFHKKSEEDKIRLEQMFKEMMAAQTQQLNNMMEANYDELAKEREAANVRQANLEEVIKEMKDANIQRDEETKLLMQEAREEAKVYKEEMSRMNEKMEGERREWMDTIRRDREAGNKAMQDLIVKMSRPPPSPPPPPKLSRWGHLKKFFTG